MLNCNGGVVISTETLGVKEGIPQEIILVDLFPLRPLVFWVNYTMEATVAPEIHLFCKCVCQLPYFNCALM